MGLLAAMGVMVDLAADRLVLQVLYLEALQLLGKETMAAVLPV